MKRTQEVLDSWIEAGSASFAERHFPFNKEFKLEDFFPPDFIPNILDKSVRGFTSYTSLEQLSMTRLPLEM